MEQIIYLDADDDIPAIRDRLEWVQTPRLLLVVPPGSHTLRSLVNLQLLRRHTRALALEVGLVTRDYTMGELAQEVGIPVFPSAEHGRGPEWVREATKKAAPRPEVTYQRPNRPRVVVARPRRGPLSIGWFGQLLTLLFFLSLSGFMVAGALLLVPEATVWLVPAREALSERLVIQARPDVEDIDYTRVRIPARLVQVEVNGSRSMPTSGQEDAPSEKAVGEVTLINRTSEEVKVPGGTAVVTSSGVPVRFTTVDTVTVPAEVGGTVQVGIIAVDAGPKGNVQPAQINTVEGPLAVQIRVINDKPTTGGSVQQARTVTQADKDRLKAMLLQQLQQEAYSMLQGQLKEQEFLPPESLQMIVLDETYDKFVDEIADSLNLEIHAVARGTAIAGQNANTLALRALEAKVKPGYQLVPEGLRFQPGEVTGMEGNAVSFVMNVSGNMVAQIDAANVAEGIRGMEIGEAELYLAQSLPLSRPPRIEVTPDWLGRVPLFSFRIEVTAEPGAG